MNLRSHHSFLLFMLITSCIVSACRETSREFDNSKGVPEGFVVIAAGSYSVGSSESERRGALTHVPRDREQALRTRIDDEFDQADVKIAGFAIGIYPVSIREYAEFIADEKYPAPNVTREAWSEVSQVSGLGLENDEDYDKYVLPLCWKDSTPPKGRLDQPVVLVSQTDALAYCTWLSQKLGRTARLPDELESEIAAGPMPYPWGEGWKAGACHANPEYAGPYSLGKLASGAVSQDLCESGIRDYAGQVYEWTSSPASREYAILKGAGCWLDGPFECRKATRRQVPKKMRHVLVGFRVVID